jgi:hypothetical protein
MDPPTPYLVRIKNLPFVNVCGRSFHRHRLGCKSMERPRQFLRIWAMRAFTSRFTSVDEGRFSRGNWIVPFDVL